MNRTFYIGRPRSKPSMIRGKRRASLLLLSSSSSRLLSWTIFFLLLLQVIGSAAAQAECRRGHSNSSGTVAVRKSTVSGSPAHGPAAIVAIGRRGTAGVAARCASEVTAFARRHDTPRLPRFGMWRPSTSTSSATVSE